MVRESARSAERSRRGLTVTNSTHRTEPESGPRMRGVGAFECPILSRHVLRRLRGGYWASRKREQARFDVGCLAVTEELNPHRESQPFGDCGGNSIAELTLNVTSIPEDFVAIRKSL